MCYHFGINIPMPIYQHKETRKRFFFIHVPRTAGRFLQENIKQNGFEPEQKIWKTIDGVEITHLYRELYEKHLDVEDIPHISVEIHWRDICL